MNLRDLPMAALRAFSVTAETRSVTKAADILGVTHSAVSKQIKGLEAWLGQPLFVAQGRGLALTSFGELMASRLTPAMHTLTETCDQVRRYRGRRVISVEAPSTFALYWLMPKLAALQQSNPGYEVWISTRNTGETPGHSRADVVIMRGAQGRVPTGMLERCTLLTERMTVVASPQLLAGQSLSAPGDIVGQALLQAATRPDDWQRWFEQAGIRGMAPGGGHRFEHMFIAMHAMREGFGALIAPANVLSLQLQRGDFVCPFPDISFAGQPYLAYALPATTRYEVDDFLVWLENQALAEG